MNPYIIVPVVLLGPQSECHPDEGHKVVKARWQPDQIQGYVPGYYEGAMVYMLGGASFMTTLTCEELDKMIAAYWKKMEEKDRNKPDILTLQ